MCIRDRPHLIALDSIEDIPMLFSEERLASSEINNAICKGFAGIAGTPTWTEATRATVSSQTCTLVLWTGPCYLIADQ